MSGFKNGSYADGNFDVENIVDELPMVDPDTGVTQYLYTIRQRALQYRTANSGSRKGSINFSATDDHGAFLIEISPPRKLSAGMVEWTRLYSHVPATQTDYESYAMHYQYISTTTPPKLLDAPKTANSRVVREFFPPTTNPASIPRQDAYRFFPLGEDIFNTGTAPGYVPEILAEDQTIMKWKPQGGIYVRRSRYVPVFNPTLFYTA